MKERTRFQRVVQAALFLAVVLFGVTSLGLVQRSIKLIAGTGTAVSASDNATTGQQEWTVSSTVTGGVSSVNGAGTVSCSPTTGAVVCTGSNAVSSVTGAGATSCSPTTGAVVCATPSVTLTSGSGISVTGGPSYVVNLAVPVAAANGGDGTVSPAAHGVAVSEGASPFNFVGPAGVAGLALVSGTGSVDPAFNTVLTVGGGTGLNAAGATGNVLTSSAGIWVSAPLTGQRVGRAIIQTDLTFASCTTNTWAHITSATVTANTVTQFVADSVTWTSQSFGTLSVVSTPTATAAPVFEIAGTQAGDRLDIRLETADTSPGSHQQEGLVMAYAVAASSPTWPGGYTFTNDTSMLSGIGNGTQSTTAAYVASAPSGGNVWIQPAIVNICAASGQTTQLGGATNVIVEDWR